MSRLKYVCDKLNRLLHTNRSVILGMYNNPYHIDEIQTNIVPEENVKMSIHRETYNFLWIINKIFEERDDSEEVRRIAAFFPEENSDDLQYFGIVNYTKDGSFSGIE